MPIPKLFDGHQDALMRGESPPTPAVGDSWFWYPPDSLLIVGCASLFSALDADHHHDNKREGLFRSACRRLHREFTADGGRSTSTIEITTCDAYATGHKFKEALK